MADLMNRDVICKTEAGFLTHLASGEINEYQTVYILDTQKVYKKGTYFGMSKEMAEKLTTLETKVTALDALKMFSRLTDGTTTVESPGKTGIITFMGEGKTTVTVDTDGVHINTAKATVATGTNNGQVNIDGQDVRSGDWAVRPTPHLPPMPLPHRVRRPTMPCRRQRPSTAMR